MPATTGEMSPQAAWWRDWWALDFSWDGLAAKPGGDSTLQDYWRGEHYALIDEPGTPRRWTRFHCPLVFADGTPSPKSHWTLKEWRDLERSVRTRLALSEADRPCRLDGCVLRTLDEASDDAGEAYLWLTATYAWFGASLSFRNNSLGLSDFSGAWFGGPADFDGARQLQPDFSDATFAEPGLSRVMAQIIAVSRPAPEAMPVPVSHPVETLPPQSGPQQGRPAWRIAAGVIVLAALAATAAILLHH